VPLLPVWLLTCLEVAFTSLFFLTLFKIRKAIAANLTVVLGPCGFLARQARVYRTMLAFARCLSERWVVLGAPECCRVRLEGQSYWRALQEAGGGIVFATAHIGAWEMASQLASLGMDQPVHVVREEELNPAAQAFMARVIRERGSRSCVTHFATDDPLLGLALAEALRRGEAVALQGDRPRARSRTIAATLFDRDFRLPAGPAALSRVTGAPLLPVFCLREGRLRYRVVFRNPILVDAEGDRDAAVAEATHRLGREIEWAIRHEPHQWFAFGPVLRHSPARR
jgi:KDO2-lipid IV(A) lauroyltransferase